MSKLYYKPIELPELPAEKKTADSTVDQWPTIEQFAIVNDRIAKELAALQAGTSELLAVARYFHAQEPVMVKL